MTDETEKLASKPAEIPAPIAPEVSPVAVESSAQHGVLDEIEKLVASFRIGEYTIEFAQALRAKLRELRTKL